MTDLSRLPQVDAVLRHPDADGVVEAYGRRPVTEAIRAAIDEARTSVLAGGAPPQPDDVLARAVGLLAERRTGRLRRVVNATGVVLHTNLGRAPLSAEARRAVAEASGYCDLEYDLGRGERGSRTGHLGALAAEACAAPAATVVNNGAAALVLVLAALSSGREAVVSRGELVEIGGSFRLPEVMAASGAVMREVGTTNRTRLADYREAVGPNTGLILKVHRSNYRVVGFTSEPGVAEMAEVARAAGVPLVHDVGSGLLRRPPSGSPVADVLRDEPAAADSLAEGADLVVFSGDKVLGGPQAGIVAGREDLVAMCARHPLARALRLDKMRRAALEATLEAHLRTEVPNDLPTWAMLAMPEQALRERAEALAEAVGPPCRAVATTSLPGGGTLPGAEIGSWAVAAETGRPDDLARALRASDPPIVGRVEAGALLLDLRTVPAAFDEELADALRRALRDMT